MFAAWKLYGAVEVVVVVEVVELVIVEVFAVVVAVEVVEVLQNHRKINDVAGSRTGSLCRGKLTRHPTGLRCAICSSK